MSTNIESSETKNHNHSAGYWGYVVVWITLLSLTAVTVAVSGISLGGFTLVLAMLIAAIKSAYVINIFMHIKFDDPIFKVFLAVAGLTLIVVFTLTSFDVFFR